MFDFDKLIEHFKKNNQMDIVDKLFLVKYMFNDFCNTGDKRMAEEIISRLLDVIAKINDVNSDKDIKLKATKQTIQTVYLPQMHKFSNENELVDEFVRYMIANGMSERTSGDYVRRLKSIAKEEFGEDGTILDIFNCDINNLIDLYTILKKDGSNYTKVNKNKEKTHNALSASLKKLNDFKILTARK